MNRNIVDGFLNKARAEGLGNLRIAKYKYTLKQLSDMLGRPFADATKEDIERLVAKIEGSNYAEWTKHDYKVAIKRFWKWLKQAEDGYPKEVSWIKTTMKKNLEKLPEDMLTEAEVAALIENTDSMRDKALISTLYESGCRVGEILSMRIKSVSFDDYGVSIQVRGKTGSRKILLVNSSPYLANWINHHPYKEPESPLWVALRSNGSPEIICYNTLRMVLVDAGKRAGLKKRLNPHNFRHSRATYLAKRLTEQQLNAYMGWVQGSGMTRVYVHLSGRDINDAILQMHGIKKPEEEIEKSKLQPKKCPRCDRYNSFEARICSFCGMSLSLETAMERERKHQELARLIDDPEILERLIERKINEILRVSQS
ncbi:MAG: tyrosine-type recombinase/integrase [Candidatus Aenigmarchaeota archaeon]|nr:tyrosine-type recombinase/integrase [Candidatus Aenigmarchaeota archaeon]